MAGYGGGGGTMSATEKAQLMDQLRNQVAVANVQQLVQTMSDKCFRKCIHYPGSGALDSRQQGCLSNCVDRFMESWNAVSKAYNERIQKERVGMQ